MLMPKETTHLPYFTKWSYFKKKIVARRKKLGHKETNSVIIMIMEKAFKAERILEKELYMGSQR